MQLFFTLLIVACDVVTIFCVYRSWKSYERLDKAFAIANETLSYLLRSAPLTTENIEFMTMQGFRMGEAFGVKRS